MRKRGLIVLLYSIILIGLFSYSAFAQDYLALQGSANGSNTRSGNVSVEIWSAATGGALLYNSSSDFWGQLNNSRYDILLGNGSQPLSLNWSMTYYMELIINERDIDFNGSERQVFQSPVGNITVDDPVKTTSTSAFALNVNDVFNVSGSNGNTATSGTLTILTNDVDDALNVSAGSIFVKQNISVNDVVNISPSQGIRIGVSAPFRADGLARLAAIDTDDALNVSAGGVFIAGNTVINNFFNMSTTTSAVRTNGTIAILSADVDDALNVSAGGVFIGGNTVFNNFFNVSTTTSAVRTNGTITILSSSATALVVNDVFNVSGTNGNIQTSGTLEIESSDVDDAINVTAGGMFVNGQIITPATNGFRATNAANSISVLTDGGIQIGSFFNVTVQNSRIRSNGSIIMVGTGSQLSLGGNTATDVLNVTNGGITIHTGNLTIGNNATQNQQGVSIGIAGSLSGNTNKCSYISMIDETGVVHYLFFEGGGNLRMSNATPSSCAEGQIVGLQS